MNAIGTPDDWVIAEVFFPDDVYFADLGYDVLQVEACGADGRAVYACGGEEDVELAEALSHFGCSAAGYGPGFAVGDACHNRFKDTATVDYGRADGEVEIGINKLHMGSDETRTITLRPMPTQLKAWQSAELGCSWILKQLEANGSLRGGDDLRAYYKTPAALLAHGRVLEANRVLDYVETRYLKPDGDLDGSGVPWFEVYRTYNHSWLCCGAVMAGRRDLARKLSGFIATRHNAASGGFFADEARSTEEIMTTSMAGIACLYAGKHELALAAGEWLANLYQAQPDLTKGLYTSWKNGLVTEYPEAEASSYLVDPLKLRQWYFQYGISAALLSSLAGFTGEERWLVLARNFLQASAHAATDRYQTPQSGKIGWGAAWTYRLSRAPEDLALVEQVSSGLAALQNDDGSWLVTGVYGGASAAADSLTLDITSEFVALQSFMGVLPLV